MTPVLILLLLSTAEIVNPIPPQTELWVTDQDDQMITSDGNRLIFKD